MDKLFISHSSQDDGFVRELRAALADHGQDGWIDSRELRGGDPLWPEIKKAIDAASAYAVVVSTDALQSKWVGKELRHALLVQEQRGKDQFPVIPLSLNGTKLGVLESRTLTSADAVGQFAHAGSSRREDARRDQAAAGASLPAGRGLAEKRADQLR
jgi:hypothetical protein